MALPVIKAKTYNYGSYANPRQVRFKQEFGASLGETFGKAVEQVAGAKVKKQKLDEEFNKGVENYTVTANMEAYKLMGDKARLDDSFRKEIATAIDDLAPARGDTVEQKIEKARGLEDLLTNLRGMASIEKSEIDYDSPSIASGSKADAINGKIASEGYYEGKYNSETKQMEIYIPEVQPYQPGMKFPTVGKKRIDVPTFAERISNLDVTYDPRADLAGLDINSKTVSSLYDQRKKEYNGFTSEDLQPDGSKDIYFDKALIKNKFLEDGSEMGMYIDAVIDKKGRTIWEDTLNKGVFDKNNPEHITQVKDKLADDIANEYSKYKIGSIAAPKIQTVNLSEGDIRRSKALNTAKNFEKQLKDNLISYNNSVGTDEPDILPLQGLFRSKSHNKLGVINEVVEGDADNPNNFTFVFDKKDSQGNFKTRTVDFTDKNEFDNFISEIGFVDSATYNQEVIDYIKSIPALFGLSEKEKGIKAIRDAEGEITPETLDIKTNLVQDKLLQANRGFRQRQLRD